MTTLKNGSRGELVKQVQNAVGVKADGIFGAKTEAAVKEFQAAHGLTADGIVGPKTWAALGVEPLPDIAIKCDDLKQGASPHGNMVYGPPGKGYTTYAKGGCGVVSFVIVQRAYGLVPAGESGTETIQRLGRYSWEHGYRIKDGGTAVGLLKTNGTTYRQTSRASDIEDALRNGRLVILRIKDGFPNGYGGKGHYIVAYGISGNYVLLRDVGSSAASRQKAALSKITNGLKGAYIMIKE